MERMKKQLGLDDPVYVRFGTYVGKLATGDLGTSFRTREPVTTMIAKRMWPTLQLILAAMMFAIVLGVPLGFVAALRPGGLVDTLSMVVAGRPLHGQILARAAADVPVRPETRLAAEFRRRWRPQISNPAGGDARRLADGAAGADHARGRARNMAADFVRTARSKGMSETRVVEWHVMRNALVSSSPPSACNSAR